MRFRISTLIDITETGEHRGPDGKRTRQQANYNAAIQTLGLRANITPVSLKKTIKNISQIGFGKHYTGVQKIWEFEFEIEFGEHTEQFMRDDFYLVPVHTGLDESVQLNTSIFETHCKRFCNTVFDRIE